MADDRRSGRGAGRPAIRSDEAGAAAVLEAAAPRVRARSRAASGGRSSGSSLVVVVLWEGLKLLAGDPIRSGDQVLWDPPLTVPFANDLSLPHIPAILASFFAPGAARQLVDPRCSTSSSRRSARGWRRSSGSSAGAVLGLVLAIAFVHSKLLERAFVPYVIASQTVPILALAPMVVLPSGRSRRRSRSCPRT